MKKTLRLQGALLGLALLATASGHAQPAPAENRITLSYVDSGTPDQTMDVLWPNGRPTAALLFIHGGSLQEGGERRSSSAYRDVCAPFVKANVACATIDYRLAPTYKWPAMPNDVAAAVKAFRRIIVERGADPSRLFLFGHSSGCQLAAVVATNPVYLQTAGLKPSDLAGAIAMGCTLDREDAALRGLTVDQIRGPFARDPVDVATYGTPEAWLSANPAGYVGPHVPPVLVVVAEAERFMPPVLEQGARFVRALIENGVPANLVLVPGKHMSSIENVGAPGDRTFAAILKWMADPRAAGAEH
jgi:acetyl esterase/lipase